MTGRMWLGLFVLAVIVAAAATAGMVALYDAQHPTPPRQAAVCTGIDGHGQPICYFVTRTD